MLMQKPLRSKAPAGGPGPLRSRSSSWGAPGPDFRTWEGAAMFPPPCCPMGLDLDGSFDSSLVVPEAGPRPIFRFLDQTAFDWIAVHIPQLLHSLLFRPHVEIIVSRLPEGAFPVPQRNRELDCLDHLVKARPRRFIHEQVNMFRHHYVSCHNEFIFLANAFQRGLEEIPRFGSGEIRKTTVTTEGEKVHLAGMLVTNESRRHGDRIYLCGYTSHVPKSEGHGAPRFSSVRQMGTWATRHFSCSMRGEIPEVQDWFTLLQPAYG